MSPQANRCCLRTLAALVTAAALGALPVPALAQSAQGFAELRAHGYLGASGQPWQLVERVRPEFGVELSERVVLSATVEAAMSQGRSMQGELQRTLEESELGPMLQAADCAWPSESNETLGVSTASDYLSVERLFVDVYLRRADLRLGRQAVQWGSATMLNPTDPFPEVLLLEPWRPRAGVNALRVTVPVGEGHQVQAVVGANDDFTAARAAAKATFGVGLADLSLVAAWRQESEDGLAGVDIRGTAGVGYWVEAALHGGVDGEVYEEVAMGIDYSFPVLENFVVALQYYRNGSGNTDPLSQGGGATGQLGGSVAAPECAGGASPFGGSDDSEERRFAPLLGGRDYGLLSAQLAITPEWSASALWLQSLTDGSGMVVPTATYLVNDWLTVSAAAQLPLSIWGDGGELHPGDDDLTLATGPAADAPRVDLGGLVPAATLIVWTRANF